MVMIDNRTIHTIVVSTQHDNFDEEKAMLEKIEDDVQNIF